jgi:spore germination protein (amino acid permease)
MSDPNRINAKQLMVYVVSTQVGLGIWTITSNLSKATGHDGWISIFLAGLVFTVFTVVIMLLLKRYREQSILEISYHLFGKIPGTIFNALLILYLLFFVVFEVRGFTEFVSLLIMPRTPPLIISMVLILPTIYLTWNGLNTVCKFSQVIFLFLAFTLFVALLLHTKINPHFLLPVGAAGAPKIIKTTAIMTFIFLGPELVAFIYPNIIDKSNALKWTVSANLFTMLSYMIVFLLAITLFGEGLAKNLKVHLFDIPRYFRLGGFPRNDFFFVFMWFPLIESALRLFFFTAYHTINRFFHWERKRWIYGLFIFLIILLARIPKDFNQLFDFSNLLSYFGGGVILYLTLCYLLSFFIKRGIS